MSKSKDCQIKMCDRNNCWNCNCERYSEEHGHICEECFEEMVKVFDYTQKYNVSNFLKTKKIKSSRKWLELTFRK